MLHLTFRPDKESIFIPKLVKWLMVAVDAFFILLMVWTVVNMCYPFWGWAIYLSTWLGFFSLVPLYYLNEHISLRSFKIAEYRYNDRNFTDNGRLKHLGFLFSVWHHSDALTLGYYHVNDRLGCRKERTVGLGYEIRLSKWLGWLVVLITDLVPLVLLVAVISTGYFLGISALIFYLMGSVLGLNMITIAGGLAGLHRWEEEAFWEGKIYPKRYVGIVTCILEGSDGELVLTMLEAAFFNHSVKRKWFRKLAMTCTCCLSMMEPVRLRHYRIDRQ
jgi:hypothetical protein